MKTLYHATTTDKMLSIIGEGIKTKYSCDGYIYLAETKADALKFICIRISGPIVVFQVDFPIEEEKNIQESFDHNSNFFKCKSFVYDKDIPSSWLSSAWRYDD